MGNTFSCFPLNTINAKHKASSKDSINGFQKAAEETNGCGPSLPFVGPRRKKFVEQVSSCSEDKAKGERRLDKATLAQSATNVHKRAVNSKQLPKPLKIEENSRYIGQVPILLSEFTVPVPTFSSNSKRTEDIATFGLYQNPKRQRLSSFDIPQKVDTSLAVPIANLAYQGELLEGYQIPRHRSFSLDNAEAVLYRSENFSKVDKGRWRKYLKYSGAVKKCLYTFECRRNTLDCPSSLDRDDLETSKLPRTCKFTQAIFNNDPYLGVPDSSNSCTRFLSVERPTKLLHCSTSAAEPSVETGIADEADQDSDHLLDESETISDNVKCGILSRKPQSMNEVIRTCQHVNQNSSVND
ncbi:hypothetical protein Gasu2_45420 [Galdieria sulphuraria]|uniref:Uncharacterized protein n=1 Tax=Galdieria sulphuraria TaxID=130081 RepID=M2XNW8_GALSU|nr:uncharacterized protein Gasu_09160 [Galdieria sulphuraria]EME31842.1 hypothetical protein Gasu_09160 [Galdieria sulphuraria]GJD10346.1 hypothetical protein Gasu2_45420 [Galdieria sulphuraria]|eukprot:XP_005708362.1 hypothetical protein Gasu_09160 [Galdieria sulphuraria]